MLRRPSCPRWAVVPMQRRRPPDEVEGGARENAAQPGPNQGTSSPNRVTEAGDQLRRRRAASWHLTPLAGGVRDPFDRLATPPGPSDFGLTRAELRVEVTRLQRLGWAQWEIRARLVNPDEVAA